MEKPISLKEEESVDIEVNGFKFHVKHNDVGISIDIWKNDYLISEEQFWFDELDERYDNRDERNYSITG